MRSFRRGQKQAFDLFIIGVLTPMVTEGIGAMAYWSKDPTIIQYWGCRGVRLQYRDDQNILRNIDVLKMLLEHQEQWMNWGTLQPQIPEPSEQGEPLVLPFLASKRPAEIQAAHLLLAHGFGYPFSHHRCFNTDDEEVKSKLLTSPEAPHLYRC